MMVVGQEHVEQEGFNGRFNYKFYHTELNGQAFIQNRKETNTHTVWPKLQHKNTKM